MCNFGNDCCLEQYLLAQESAGKTCNLTLMGKAKAVNDSCVNYLKACSGGQRIAQIYISPVTKWDPSQDSK